MATSKATTPDAYIAALPADRRAALEKVRRVVLKNLPEGYREGIGWGAITWEVPLEVYPDTYNGQPLCYAALANQKNYASLYLMVAYGSPVQLKRLQDGFRKAGKKLDMGKSCIHFKSADDLALDVIGEVVASTPMDRYVEIAKVTRRGRGKNREKR